MNRALRTLVLLAGLGVLVALLVLVASLCRDGVRITYSGDVRLVGIPEEIRLRLDEPVVLTMPDGTALTATVAGTQADPVALAFASALCPTCGAAMLPARFHILTGEIEWACPQCEAPKP